MKKKFWKRLRVTVGLIAAIIGFIASVTGIASWLGITSIHLGNIIVPNPIIIVVATLIAILLIAAAFLTFPLWAKMRCRITPPTGNFNPPASDFLIIR